MMKYSLSKSVGFPMLALMAAIALVSINSAYAQDGYSVVVYSSPSAGGSVMTGSGGNVEKYALNQQVELRAVPSSGYRFVQWLGDVSQVTASKTSLVVDSPKMIVAVFERTEFEQTAGSFIQTVSGASGGGGGGGFAGRGPSVTTAGPSTASTGPVPAEPFDFSDFFDDDDNGDDGDDDVEPEPEPQENTEVPVPGGEDNPIPEPSTVLILGAGFAVLRVFSKGKPVKS